MERLYEMTLLYDFYGELLTEKQRLVFEMYNQNDLSLSETGAELNISRQAVSEKMRQIEKILGEYENKLRLAERFLKRKELSSGIKTAAEALLPTKDDEKIRLINEIKKLAEEIID